MTDFSEDPGKCHHVTLGSRDNEFYKVSNEKDKALLTSNVLGQSHFRHPAWEARIPQSIPPPLPLPLLLH